MWHCWCGLIDESSWRGSVWSWSKYSDLERWLLIESNWSCMIDAHALHRLFFWTLQVWRHIVHVSIDKTIINILQATQKTWYKLSIVKDTKWLRIDIFHVVFVGPSGGRWISFVQYHECTAVRKALLITNTFMTKMFCNPARETLCRSCSNLEKYCHLRLGLHSFIEWMLRRLQSDFRFIHLTEFLSFWFLRVCFQFLFGSVLRLFDLYHKGSHFFFVKVVPLLLIPTSLEMPYLFQVLSLAKRLAKRLPLKGADDAEGTVNSVKSQWQMVVENICLVRHLKST